MLQGVGEPSYAAVAQFLVDFDTPFRQLPNVFAPHKKVVSEAVMSLKKIFDVRYLTPTMLRKDSPYVFCPLLPTMFVHGAVVVVDDVVKRGYDCSACVW